MKTSKFLTIGVCMILLIIMSCTEKDMLPIVEKGVSQQLAIYRKANIENVRYTLFFDIPDKKEEKVMGNERISFQWKGKDDLQIDFQGELLSLKVNGEEMKADYHDEHIVIPADKLKQGENNFDIRFSSKDKALNRNDDYLYTLFVPDHARSVFPCFDQPDLKAHFSLTLSIPEGWTAISNGKEMDNISNNLPQKQENGSILYFEVTEKIPTYLFSFTTGKFQEQKAVRDGRQLTILYRETAPGKVAQLPTVFDEIALSLRWLENYTGIPYPFKKYGCVVLPGYQFGGMEHPGCIQFRDRTIFLSENPTPDEELNRLQLIAHETAHMWFGDLVTMRWFNDVWTKEVFANFMADKIGREQFPNMNHDLNFIKTHYIAALVTDRTQGTHPIQQPLDNLNNAGLLYGNIIYHKAPIMMRKLEEQMGAEPFRNGLRKYLNQYSYGNATWDDLIAILDAENPQAGIKKFDQQWVKSKGVEIVHVNTAGNQPLPNLDGMGYARYQFDDSTAVQQYINRWNELSTEQSRIAAAMTVYENYLMHKAPIGMVFKAVRSMANSEKNELALSTYFMILNQLAHQAGTNQRTKMEESLWTMANEHPVKSFRQQILQSLCSSAISPALTDSIKRIWQSASNPLLTERNYINMSYHLALLLPTQWKRILAQQRARLKNEDVIKEFDFVSRACNPDTLEQKKLFEMLLRKENRAIEPYAANILSLLNSDLREPFNNQFVLPGLEILEEIQRTGDIFFPLDWCNALLGEHRSSEAKALVEKFLKDHPNYPEPLKNKLLQAAFMMLNRE